MGRATQRCGSAGMAVSRQSLELLEAVRKALRQALDEWRGDAHQLAHRICAAIDQPGDGAIEQMVTDLVMVVGEPVNSVTVSFLDSPESYSTSVHQPGN